MRVDPQIQKEIRVLESRLSDRTLPPAEHDRLRARLIDLRRQLSGVPSPEELTAIIKRIEALEEGQAKLHELIAYIEAKLQLAATPASTAPGQVTCDAVNQLNDLQTPPIEAKTAKRGRPRKLTPQDDRAIAPPDEPISESLEDFLSE